MKFCSFLYIFILFSIVIPAQNNNSELEGKWESVSIKNQRGILISFESSNIFWLSHTIVADYRYELKDNMLISYLKKDDPDKIVIDTSYLIIRPDTIVRWYNRLGWKDTVIMVRTGFNDIDSSNRTNPFVGKWKWKYPTGDTAFSTFYNDGKWHFYLPTDKYKGSYSVNADTLITSFDAGKGKQKRIFWIEGKLLGLKDIDSDIESLYRRIVQ